MSAWQETRQPEAAGPPEDAGDNTHVSIAAHPRRRPPQSGLVIGASLTAFFIAVAVFGPLVVTTNPLAVNPSHALQSPSASHLFGTDEFGRDVLARTIDGTRVAMIVAILTTVFALTIGGALATAAGYLGGFTDRVVMRVMDILLAFPFVVLAIALAWVLGPSLSSVVIVVTVVRVPEFARVVYGSVVDIRAREFITASETLGRTPLYVVGAHIIPNVAPRMISYATTTMGLSISMAAALSFLGVGVPPPQPSWGNMLQEGQAYLSTGYWIPLFPGIGLIAVVLAFNLLGDSFGGNRKGGVKRHAWLRRG